MKIVRETEVKRGRRLYGHIVELDDGQKIYLARRKHGQIFRSGHGSISAAMQEEQAAWAIDEVTLYNLRAKGIKIVGVRTTDTGDLYLTRIEYFFDLKKAKVIDYSASGGSRQRYLPLQFFTYRRGDPVVAGATPSGLAA